MDEHFYYEKERNTLIISKGILFVDNQKNPLGKIAERYWNLQLNLLKEIPGMFLLLLINFNRQEVILACDSIGALRLYYSFQEDILYFSSQLNKISSTSELSKEGLIQYSLINYYVDEKTIFKNVNRVLPGYINVFKRNHKNEHKYFDLVNYLAYECPKKSKISIYEVSEVLKQIILNYSDYKTTLTLTSGYDSRLLLSAALSQGEDLIAFTFGVKDNLEFKIAEEIAKAINWLKYFQVELGNEFDDLISSYYEFIKQSKNIEVNFNRFHYYYVWNKLKSVDDNTCILSGLCGDSFIRNGLSVSHQTNELLINIIYTKDKELTVKNYLESKIDLLNKLNLSKTECSDYLMHLFSDIKNDDKYNNHFHIKINFGIRNYFATEMNLENEFISTYPVFLDLRYLEMLVRSGYSIFTNKFLDNPNKYKIKSHRYYYLLIKNLCPELNLIKTNRGFPLKYSASIIYLPFRYIKQKRFLANGYKTDLNYLVGKNY